MVAAVGVGVCDRDSFGTEVLLIIAILFLICRNSEITIKSLFEKSDSGECLSPGTARHAFQADAKNPPRMVSALLRPRTGAPRQLRPRA